MSEHETYDDGTPVDPRIVEMVNTPLGAGDFEVMERQVKASLDLCRMEAPHSMDEAFLMSVAIFVMRAKKSLKLDEVNAI